MYRKKFVGEGGWARLGSQHRTATAPEAESSVAFEAPAEEPNLTLVIVFMEIWWG